MQKIRSHEWDVGIQGCRINGGRINEGRLYLPLTKLVIRNNSFKNYFKVSSHHHQYEGAGTGGAGKV